MSQIIVSNFPTASARVASSSVSQGVTLIIALVGLVVAVCSLAWQIITFMGSGSRVRVEVKIGGFTAPIPDVFLTMSNMHLLEPDKRYLVKNPIYFSREARELAPEDLVKYWLIADIRNVGRLPVTVESVIWEVNEHTTIHTWDWPGTAFPHRLDSHDWCIATVPIDGTMIMAKPLNKNVSELKIRPIISLGNARKLVGRSKTIPVYQEK